MLPSLRRALPDWVVFDVDLLAYDRQEVDWQELRASWVRVAFGVTLGRRPCLLCGLFWPPELSRSDYYHRFSRVLYLVLTCRPEIREARLRARNMSPEELQQHMEYAQRLRRHADEQQLTVVDNSDEQPSVAADRIADWGRSLLGAWP